MTATPTPLDPDRAKQLSAEFGLKPDEYDRVLAILGRTPSLTELGMFSRDVVGALLLQIVAASGCRNCRPRRPG